MVGLMIVMAQTLMALVCCPGVTSTVTTSTVSRSTANGGVPQRALHIEQAFEFWATTPTPWAGAAPTVQAGSQCVVLRISGYLYEYRGAESWVMLQASRGVVSRGVPPAFIARLQAIYG